MGLNDAAYGVSILIVYSISKLPLNIALGFDPLCTSSALRDQSQKAERRFL